MGNSAAAGNGGAAISVRDLRKSFGDVHALAGVSLEVATGTVLGLLGPNGAGKTTFVRVLDDAAQARRRRGQGRRPRRRPRRGAPAPGDRPRRPVRRGRREPHRPGEPDHGRTALRDGAPHGPRPRPGAAGALRSRRGRRPAGEDLLRRHAPPPRPRRGARRLATGAVSRRADHRAWTRAAVSGCGR